MKYIIFQTNDNLKLLLPIIFPKYLVHSEVAKYFELLIRRSLNYEVKLYSAGECNFFGGEVTCNGKSETLNISSHPEDSMVISNYSYTNGII